MDLNQAIAPARPLLQLVGALCLIVGLLKFFGVNVPVNFAGLELAVAGFLMKAV